jgi:hypothetical protein
MVSEVLLVKEVPIGGKLSSKPSKVPSGRTIISLLPLVVKYQRKIRRKIGTRPRIILCLVFTGILMPKKLLNKPDTMRDSPMNYQQS